jgi:hypothetical protein
LVRRWSRSSTAGRSRRRISPDQRRDAGCAERDHPQQEVHVARREQSEHEPAEEPSGDAAHRRRGVIEADRAPAAGGVAARSLTIASITGLYPAKNTA